MAAQNIKIITNNEEETFTQGMFFARQLTSGGIVAFFGNLGAGKTKFIQGMAKGLEVQGIVNSPTFNIMKIYKTKNNLNIKNLCHIDAYRLNSEQDLISLGIEEIIEDKKTIVAIEWSEKVEGILRNNSWRVVIKSLSDNKREIKIKKDLS